MLPTWCSPRNCLYPWGGWCPLPSPLWGRAPHTTQVTLVFMGTLHGTSPRQAQEWDKLKNMTDEEILDMCLGNPLHVSMPKIYPPCPPCPPCSRSCPLGTPQQ